MSDFEEFKNADIWLCGFNEIVDEFLATQQIEG